MDRKIDWVTGRFDEIELVYDKAEENDSIGSQLEQLEEKALAEARACSPAIRTEQGPLTPEQFDALSESGKENVIWMLSNHGLAKLGMSREDLTITMEFSPVIQDVLACTMFNVINRLEKLDGTFMDKVTLEFKVPLGGKKGFFQWEMLIMSLYPWISVRETSTSTVAAGLLESIQASAKAAPQSAKQPAVPALPQKQSPAQAPAQKAAEPEKKSFFKKLFGK